MKLVKNIDNVENFETPADNSYDFENIVEQETFSSDDFDGDWLDEISPVKDGDSNNVDEPVFDESISVDEPVNQNKKSDAENKKSFFSKLSRFCGDSAAEKQNVEQENKKTSSKIIAPEVKRKSMAIWVALVALAGVVAIAIQAYSGAADNDMWWLFATGREIVQNGIPYENPFSIYDGQGIVIQQWLAAVLDFLIYDNFGIVGIAIMVVVLIFALAASAFVFSRGVAEDKGFGLAALFAALLILGSSPYLSVRPQVWSMIAYILILAVMERYRRNGNWKTLIFLPVIVLVHVNLHMSLMLMDFAIVGLYLINPNYRGHGVSAKLASYPRIPILIALVVMGLAALLNPYGFAGATYLLLSYDTASYNTYILEMQPLNASHYYALIMLFSIVVGACCMGKNGLKNIDFPLYVLFILSIYMATQHTRNVWLVSLFVFALATTALSEVRLTTKLRILADDPVKVGVLSVVLLVSLVTGIISTTPSMETDNATDGKSTPVKAIEYLDDHVADKKSVKLLTSFDMGGYVEWNGYRVSMDPRPELWAPPITGFEKDYYAEFVDLAKGDLASETYMEDKDVDYAIVPTDYDISKYLAGSSDYRQVLEGNGYKMFQHKKAADDSLGEDELVSFGAETS